MSITINLPAYDIQSTYDRNKFLKFFPDSMISAAFQDPEETHIDLTSKIMTPYVLEYLQTMLETVDAFPPPKTDLTEAGRYLLISVLEIVSRPEYIKFQAKYPNINLLDSRSLQDNYSSILVYSLLYNYPLLRTYLWTIIDKDGQDNYDGLYVSAYMNNVSVFKELMGKGSNQTMKYEYFRGLVEIKDIDPRLDALLKNTHLTLSEACMLGNAREC